MRRALCPLAAFLALVLPAAAGSHTEARRLTSYPWPLKPFDREHPVRANFDDPRVEFVGDELATNFHFGIDIAATDGTPVYAVAPGIASRHGDYVDVLAASGRDFGYWHVTPAVKNHRAVKQGDLLGHVERGWGHVHFAENLNGVYVNPLRRGALAPYTDATPPTVEAVSVTRAATAVDPAKVSGVVDLTCDAYDVPEIDPPWPWQESRVTPALIRWRIVAADGEPATRWKTAVDFRFALLPDGLFSLVYARGTKQNRSNRPGRYVFYLAEGWSSAKLPNGSYRLVVGAWDIRGNGGYGTLPFTIANEKR